MASAYQALPDGPPVEEETKEVKPAETVAEHLRRAVRLFGNNPCVGTRLSPSHTEWLSYRQVADMAHWFGVGLTKQMEHHFPYGTEGNKVGIMSRNNVAWVATEWMAASFGFPIVPLYDTLGEDAVEHILKLTELTVLVVEEAKFPTVAKQLDRQNYSVNTLVVIKADPNDSSLTEDMLAFAQRHVGCFQVVAFRDVLRYGILYENQHGKEDSQLSQQVKPDDLFTIMFTSGTTGVPKGVMITHGGLMANLHAIANRLQQFMVIDETDCLVSYLPLSHIFEQLLELYMYGCGGRVGMYRGDVRLLVEDLQHFKPTVFASVPRLFNRVYGKVMTGVQQKGCLSRKLFRSALTSKPGTWWQGFLDWLVLSKVRAKLGGKVRLVVSGSAPIAAEVAQFFRTVFKTWVEGYGLSECAVATMTNPDSALGHVGYPLDGCRMKLAPVDEIDFKGSGAQFGVVAGSEGEVCMKGPSVFAGYYKNPEKTAEVMDAEGWFHSGDIGRYVMDAVSGFSALKIFDRKKEILKLSQGEYVSPSKIENLYLAACPCIEQIFVHGESLQAYLVAVVVLSEQGATLPTRTVMDELSHADVNLRGFERPRKFFISEETFSVENDLLTPTFKLKRRNLVKQFQNAIQMMYVDK